LKTRGSLDGGVAVVVAVVGVVVFCFTALICVGLIGEILEPEHLSTRASLKAAMMYSPSDVTGLPAAVDGGYETDFKDEWGKAIRIYDKPQLVLSAGPDGFYHTSDDITLELEHE
jgi:hypothetical protein